MPDTGAYLLLGLAVTAILLGFFVVSLYVRHRNLSRDMELIRQLAADDQ